MPFFENETSSPCKESIMSEIGTNYFLTYKARYFSSENNFCIKITALSPFDWLIMHGPSARGPVGLHQGSVHYVNSREHRSQSIYSPFLRLAAWNKCFLRIGKYSQGFGNASSAKYHTRWSTGWTIRSKCAGEFTSSNDTVYKYMSWLRDNESLSHQGGLLKTAFHLVP